jgi:hypothetical protein
LEKVLMKSGPYIFLVICLTFSLMGCAAINTYHPGYEPSEWETSVGPPDWWLTEHPDKGNFETTND